MKQYDYLIVGAGLFGAVFAHEAKKAGKKCLVVDKRDHIAGNISMGAVNVQVIMESLGGGGHQTMAAAQLKHITLQAARSRIQDAIDQYYLSQKKTTPEA